MTNKIFVLFQDDDVDEDFLLGLSDNEVNLEPANVVEEFEEVQYYDQQSKFSQISLPV